MKEPEVITNPQKIDKLIKRIDDSDIKVPAFQRGYVWKQNQVIELMQSIISDYPIGSILLWEASEGDRLRSTRNIAGYQIPEKSESYPVNYVLDGQQRLSSIYGIFSDELTQDKTSARYNPNLDIFEVYYDFQKSDFLPKSDVDVSSPHAVYLRNLLDPIRLFDELEKIEKAHHQAAKELSSKFLNYDLPVVTIKNRSRKDVGLIFERINNTGTKLDTIDLLTAWTWTEDFHLLEASNELSEELESKGFGNIPNKLLLQIISGILIGSTKTGNVLTLSGSQVRDGWSGICESLRRTIDFLSTELRCKHIDFLPFNQQLVVISKFFSMTKQPDGKQLSELKKWFWRTAFSDRYSTGQTTSKMDVDLETMKSIISKGKDPVSKYAYTTTASELIAHQFSKTNPLTRAFLLLMAQNDPKDLVRGTTVDLGIALSAFNRKEYHHVFPNAFLNKLDLKKEQRFSIVNFCFLPSDSNKQISKKSPSDYFFNLVPSSSFKGILQSNLLPLEKSIYKTDDYDAFLEQRAELIVSEIDLVAGG